MLECKTQFQRIDNVIILSNRAGCHHILMLLGRLVLRQLDIQVLEYNYYEACDRKDICDRLIAPKKGHPRKYVNSGNDAYNASHLVKDFQTFSSIPGEHLCFQFHPYDVEKNKKGYF